MSAPTGGPAFPMAFAPDACTEGGMTLRDYFAAAALQGMLANSNTTGHDALDVVEASWAIADKMIELKDKP